ncbi:MAG: molecular chaperone DnaJ [Thermodesulfobacteriota bacterium]
MSEKDYYGILGVGRDADADEIKKAFRRLAHEFHPDKHKGAREVEEKFKEINEAYEVLKDPDKRAQYDRFGYVGAGPGGPGPGYRETGFGSDFQDLFGDVFSEFFGAGGRRRGPGPEAGVDLRYDLEITFEEAAFGTEKSVDIPRSATCKNCSGSGARPGTSPVQCSTCNGAGQVRFQQGFFSIARPCPACSGKGTVIKEPCAECSGMGKVRVRKTIKVKVPPGVDAGSRLRIMGEGEPGERGGPPGDLYVVLSVAPHEFFRREHDDIICEVPISFTQAALGAEIEVPSIEGLVKLKIPHGTQSGKVFRLKGKGIASLRTGRRGDEQVVIKVEVPTKLTRRQKELLEEFAQISGEEGTSGGKNFFSRVKEIFE